MSLNINIKDVISGLITPIMIIATSLSYAVLIFSGPLADYLTIGAGFSLIGAGVTAIIFAIGSDLPFAISGPDSKAVAVMASIVTVIAANSISSGQHDTIGPTVLAALITGTLIVGVTSYIFGALKLGRWIRFMPYPVIGGFMAASGWFLVSGAIRVLAQESLSLKLLADIASGSHIAKLLVGGAIALALNISQTTKHPLAFPGTLIGGGVCVLLGVIGSDMSIDLARKTGWLIQISTDAVSVPAPWLLTNISKINSDELVSSGAQYCALVTVVIATLLLSIMAIEVEAKKEVELDQELKLNGLANILSGLCGGTVGTLSVSRTLFSYRLGARGRLSGILVGILCLSPLALGPSALGYVPMPVLGAVLLQLGASMLYEWIVKSWQNMQRIDYLQLIVIFFTIVCFDFVAGVGVGIITACMTFAVNTARIRLIKHAMDRSNFSSRVDRPIYETDTLHRYGESIQIIWLHGFIFFGSAHHLLMNIKATISAKKRPCRSLILDFKQVLGIDSSAAMTLVKLRHYAEQEGFQLVLSNLSNKVENSLQKGGLMNGQNDSDCLVFQNLDAALEWCENNLLTSSSDEEKIKRSTEEWLKIELGKDNYFFSLEKYLEVLLLQPGDYLFSQGQSADCLYLLSSGRVTILFKSAEGVELRLRTMLGHTLIGEMGLYRSAPRGASVIADEPTTVYRISSQSMQRMETEEPELAHAFHKFVIRTLAARLDFANREVAGLQR